MKKRIIFISLCCICSVLFLPNVSARGFIEEKNFNYKFDISQKGINTHLIKKFSKITDEEGIPYYEITPRVDFFNNRDDYKEKITSIDSNMLERFSKIMYFGYGYKKQNEDAYYFATQYLIYQEFKDLNIVYNMDNVESHFMDKEINEILENIKNVTFSLTDFTTKENVFEITNSYIIDNFKVTGSDIEVSYEKEKIKILFLKENQNYDLHFQPKNTCKDVLVWSSLGMELLGKQEVCEKEYQISVQYESNQKEDSDLEITEKEELNTPSKDENKEPIEETKKPEVDKEDDEEETEQESEIEENDDWQGEEEIPVFPGEENLVFVDVPNTSKYRYPFISLFFSLGGIYCVRKK